jgi:predicted secreted hydrolase
MKAAAFVVVALYLLGGCQPAPPAEPQLRVGDVLGGGEAAGFLRADAPRVFAFPQDHALHPGFRNEWWYITGNVSSADGRRFGYQVTFFTTAVRPPATAVLATAQPSPTVSNWDSERVWMAHLAVTDMEAGEHYAFERFSRENPGLAGAQTSPFKVWLDDWQLTGSAADDTLPWTLQVAAGDFSLRVELQPLKPPVLQGEQGLSQKSPEPGNASYYYSMTRLATHGELHLGAETFAVAGNSWLDREWSTSALASDQTGWDWFSLQFDDGQELMYYQLRDTGGKAHPGSGGNWTDLNAQQTPVTPAQVQLEPLQSWRSPQGIDYTVAWRLHYADQVWRIEAVLENQLMDVSFVYWEGAVVIRDESSGATIGRGYLEMVRQ